MCIRDSHCTDPFNFYPGTSPDIVDIKFWGAVYGLSLIHICVEWEPSPVPTEGVQAYIYADNTDLTYYPNDEQVFVVKIGRQKTDAAASIPVSYTHLVVGTEKLEPSQVTNVTDALALSLIHI